MPDLLAQRYGYAAVTPPLSAEGTELRPKSPMHSDHHAMAWFVCCSTWTVLNNLVLSCYAVGVLLKMDTRGIIAHLALRYDFALPDASSADHSALHTSSPRLSSLWDGFTSRDAMRCLDWLFIAVKVGWCYGERCEMVSAVHRKVVKCTYRESRANIARRHASLLTTSIIPHL